MGGVIFDVVLLFVIITVCVYCMFHSIRKVAVRTDCVSVSVYSCYFSILFLLLFACVSDTCGLGVLLGIAVKTHHVQRGERGGGVVFFFKCGKFPPGFANGHV